MDRSKHSCHSSYPKMNWINLKAITTTTNHPQNHHSPPLDQTQHSTICKQIHYNEHILMALQSMLLLSQTLVESIESIQPSQTKSPKNIFFLIWFNSISIHIEGNDKYINREVEEGILRETRRLKRICRSNGQLEEYLIPVLHTSWAFHVTDNALRIVWI